MSWALGENVRRKWPHLLPRFAQFGEGCFFFASAKVDFFVADSIKEEKIYKKLRSCFLSKKLPWQDQQEVALQFRGRKWSQLIFSPISVPGLVTFCNLRKSDWFWRNCSPLLPFLSFHVLFKLYFYVCFCTRLSCRLLAYVQL